MDRATPEVAREHIDAFFASIGVRTPESPQFEQLVMARYRMVSSDVMKLTNEMGDVQITRDNHWRWTQAIASALPQFIEAKA